MTLLGVAQLVERLLWEQEVRWFETSYRDQMKICSRCKVSKPLTDFYKSGRMKDGVQSSCKECMAESYKRNRAENVDHYKAVAAARYEQNLIRLNEWKSLQKCKCCNEADACCLDLHHLDPNEKDVNISDVVRYWSWDRLMSELDKCIVVCANCHRKIHAGVIVLGVA